MDDAHQVSGGTYYQSSSTSYIVNGQSVDKETYDKALGDLSAPAMVAHGDKATASDEWPEVIE